MGFDWPGSTTGILVLRTLLLQVPGPCQGINGKKVVIGVCLSFPLIEEIQSDS